MSDSFSGAFQLLLDNQTIFLIQACTNVEARETLGNEDWSVSRFDFLAFGPIALLYVRRAYGGKNIPLDTEKNLGWRP